MSSFNKDGRRAMLEAFDGIHKLVDELMPEIEKLRLANTQQLASDVLLALQARGHSSLEMTASREPASPVSQTPQHSPRAVPLSEGDPPSA